MWSRKRTRWSEAWKGSAVRVAVISGVFPKVSETFVLRHVTGLLELGHGVDIYSDFRPHGSDFPKSDAVAAAMEARTTYMDVPSLKTGKRFLTAPRRLIHCARTNPELTLAALNPLQFGIRSLTLSQLHRLYILMRSPARYDVVHAHFGMVGDRFRFTSALWDVPLVVGFHGFDYSVWPRQRGPDCFRRLFELATTIVVNSEHTRQRVHDLGCPPAKVAKVYASWDLESFVYRDHPRGAGQPLRVLTVGRLVEKKGIDDGIRAIAHMCKVVPDVQYDIVGEGPQRVRLEALIDDLGVREKVRLHGAQPSAYVTRMMADAHAFLLPSVTASSGDEEGLGVVLLEAQASGLPVVATTHGPFPEVVLEGETGFLVPEHAPTMLAQRLLYLFERPEVALAMGAAGRRHVETRFHPRSISLQCIAVYEAAIKAYRSRAAGAAASGERERV